MVVTLERVDPPNVAKRAKKGKKREEVGLREKERESKSERERE